MPSPFPGMNPYLEHPELWPGVHHLLISEIDLLRQGKPMPFFGQNLESHYRILVARGNRRPSADFYAFNVRDAIPTFPLPLRPGDPEPAIALQALLSEVYDLYGYDLAIDYRQEPLPPLSDPDAAWADTLLREQGIR
jgi:Protein of unknown function (DUF4058)